MDVLSKQHVHILYPNDSGSLVRAESNIFADGL